MPKKKQPEKVIIVTLHDNDDSFIVGVTRTYPVAKQLVEKDIARWSKREYYQDKTWDWQFTEFGVQAEGCSGYYTFEEMDLLKENK